MSSAGHDRGRIGIFGTARRAFRASTNASKASLKPIAENRPLTSTGTNDKSTDPEKEGYDPSGTTGTPPKETAKDEEAEDRDRRREVHTIPRTLSSLCTREPIRMLTDTPCSMDSVLRGRRRRHRERPTVISTPKCASNLTSPTSSVHARTKGECGPGQEV